MSGEVEMSGFDLTIEFGGMCLFVPRERRVHVLLPRVEHDGHEPRLFVHKQYFVDPRQYADLEHVGDLYIIPLSDRQIAFSAPNQVADTKSIKGKGIASVSEHVRKSSDHAHKNKDKVPTSLLSGTPGGKLKSRIDLLAGSMTDSTCSGPWTLGKVEERAMAISANWRINQIERFPAEIPFDLAPPQGRTTMTVHIFNTPRNDNPTTVLQFEEDCTAANHFPWFYPTLELGMDELEWRDVPTYRCRADEVEAKPGRPSEHAGHSEDRGSSKSPDEIRGRRLTCLLGEAEPGG